MKYLFDDSDELPDLNIDDLSGIESTFNCPDFAKLYKTTKSGLSRHYKTKHVMTEGSSKLSCEKLQAAKSHVSLIDSWIGAAHVLASLRGGFG